MNLDNLSKKILIIDNDLVIRYTLKKIFSNYLSSNLKIYTSSDGLQGLGYVYVVRPDLIIIDSTLPKYSGRELTEYIRTNETLKTTPVILLNEGKERLENIPENFIQVSKVDKEFPSNLVNIVKEVLGKRQNEEWRMQNGDNYQEQATSNQQRFVNFLAKKILRYSNISDVESQKVLSRNIFIKSIYYIKYLFDQFLTSIYLTFFYVFVGKKDYEETVDQKQKDVERFRVKTFPALAFGLALIFFGIIQFFLLSGVFVALTYVATAPAYAASYTWDGGGTDGTCGGQAGDGNKWSCAANWSSDIVPTAADAVTFNSTSTKDATIDASFGGTVTSLTIATGYSGTITVSRSFTMSTSFSQATGTFNGTSQTITDSGTFSLTGGTFTSTSGNFSVASTFTISGGTFNHNNGTVTFNGGAASLTCGSAVFNLVSFTGQTGGKTVGTCTLPLGNNPTIPTSTTIFGVLSGTGTLTQSANSMVIQGAGASLSGFSGLNVAALSVIGGATLNASSYTSFVVSGSVDMNAGSALTLPTGADLNGSLVITGGTFNAPSGTMTIAANFTVSGSPTFNTNGGTMVFDGVSAQTLTCNNITFGSVSFLNNGPKAINSGCNVPIGTNPTYTGTSSLILAGGTVSGSGTLSAGHLTWNSGTLSGFSALTITNDFTIGGGNVDLSAMTFVSNAATAVILNSGTLTLPSGADINGNLTITGGTFNAPSGTLTLAGNLTISGSPTFNANSGTINFDGASVQTIACNNVTFATVLFNNGGKTINSNCTIPIGNNPTVPNNLTLAGGTLSGTGKITSGRVTINAGGTLSGFNAMSMTNDLNISGGTVNLGSYTSFDMVAGAILTISSGSLTLPTGSDLNGNFVMTGGTFNAPSGNMTIAGAFTISGSTTFNHNNGTITFDGSIGASLTCNNVTFNQVIFSHTSSRMTVLSGCTLPLGNNPTIANGIIINTGTLAGTGTLNLTSASTLTMNTGAGLSGFTGFSSAQALTIAGANLDFSGYSTFVENSVLTLSSGSVTLPSGSDLNNNLTISGGTFNAPSGNMTLAGTLSVSGSPTFNHNNGVITLDGTTTATLSCNNVTFNKIVFAHTSGTKTTLNDCTIPVGNDPIISSSVGIRGIMTGTGTLTSNGGTFTVTNGGTLTSFSGINIGSLVVSASSASTNLDLSSFSTISIGTLTMPSPTNPFTNNIKAPAGSMSINILTIAAGSTLNANGGIINFNGGSGTIACGGVTFNLVNFTGASGTKTISSDCSLPLGSNPAIPSLVTLNGTLTGSGTIAFQNNTTFNTGSIITGFSGVSFSSQILVAGATLNLASYSTFNIASTLTLSSGSLALPAGSDLNGALIISGGTLTAPSGNITLAGNSTISGSGVFTHNNGTVILDGTNQTISGAFTFKNLTKNVSAVDTLTFPASTTQAVLGTLTLKGISGNLLSLRSSSNGSAYTINPTLVDIQYLDVKDFNNTGASVIQASGKNITNSGNNTRWNFDNPSISSVGPIYLTNGSNIANNKPAYSFNITDPQALDTVKYQIQIDNNSDFSSPEVDYTSVLQAQGAATFTVGQALGSGIYTVGAANQNLADGNYYTRIKGIDGTGGDGGYSTVNGTSSAFTVDTTKPTGSVIFGYKIDSTSRDIYLILTATDSLSGVDKMMISENSNFANATFEEYKTSKAYAVSDGYGTKNIYVKFRDKAGNESATYTINPSYTQVIVTPSTTPGITQVPVSYGVPIGGSGNLTDGLSVIALRVIGKTNNPLANVPINIPALGINTTTDENGLVVLQNVPLGSYDVLGLFNNKEFNQNLDITGEQSVITLRLEDTSNILTIILAISLVTLTVAFIVILLILKMRKQNGDKKTTLNLDK